MTEQRYRVVKRLEAGGMAEVYVGEAQSVQGFKKKVAIKRVLPHLAQNKNFIGMFLDEARLGARLNHANIVSVFDIGAADDTFFIVMEFVDGCNLKKLIEVGRRMGRTIPLKEAVYLCMEACRGLSYAHELTDDDGNDLDLVHRDVSPPNILISKRGEVKVTDFGLAKATTQLEKTDPGVVKGKFSYLSPEAAQGVPVDERADVFALGIVLWEMLAGRRLFLGETDYQTVKLVQEANVPPISRLNSDADEEFEGVLNKSMARDPDQRFGSAREFGDALAGYLFSHQLKVTSYDIANLVKQTLADDDGAPSTRQQSIIDKLIQEELLRFTSLDDVSEASEVTGALSPDTSDGAQPLDAGLFENPADWFSGDADVAHAMDQATGTPSAPGWRESGLEGLAGLEDDEAFQLGAEPISIGSSSSIDMAPIGEGAPPPLAAAADPADEPSPNAAPRVELEPEALPSSGGGGGLVALILLLLAAAGGAAYYFLVMNPQ